MKFKTYVMRTKWIVLLLALVVLIIFARTVKSPALTKSAIVIGIGIDFFEDSKEFEVTTQSVIMSSSSNESNATSSFQTFTDTGKTISGALDNISRKMGLTVTLAHCEVLFLSRAALKLDHLQLIYPLTGMYALREQALVVSGDKTPREMLAFRIGTTISSPYFLQSALLSQEGTDGMIRTTAKNFLTRSLSKSGAVVIPYISANKMQDQPIDQQGEQKDNYEFDLSKTLVFSHERSEILDEEMSEILAIYLSEATYGALNYTYPDGRTIEYRILDKQVKTSAKGRAIKIDIKLSVDLLDFQHIDSDTPITSADKIVSDTADLLAQKLTDTLNKLWDISKEWDIDFLGMKAKAYQSVGRRLEDDCMPTLTVSPSVKIRVKEAS